MQDKPIRLSKADVVELLGTAGLKAFPAGDNVLNVGGTLYAYYQPSRKALRPAKPVVNRAIVRMLHSVTRSQLEKRIGGEWFMVTELPNRRTNGRVVTYRQARKDKPGVIECCVRVLGGRLFSGPTWSAVAAKIGVSN